MGPGHAIISILFESGVETHKSDFSHKIVKNKACAPQVETKTVPKVVKVLPSSAHRAPKCSKMQPRAVIFPYFWAIIVDLGPPFLKAASGNQFSAQNDPPDTQNQEKMYILTRNL